MKKKGTLFLFTALILFCIWYFFVKSFDYQIRFTTKFTTGGFEQTLFTWNRSLPNHKPIQNLEKGKYLQTISSGDTLRTYTWHVKAKKDSIINVLVGVNEKGNTLKNRFSIAWPNAKIKTLSKEHVSSFFTVLNEHLKRIKVTVEGESQTYPSHYIFVSHTSEQWEKAYLMMRDYNLLGSYIVQNHLEATGTPFTEITSWNKETNTISFNFCFPIKPIDSIPSHPEITYGKTDSKKAIKAIYNGNYITSDRAWYEIEIYAKKNAIPISQTPLEYYYNNPNMGGDELQWKTEVFFPIKED